MEPAQQLDPQAQMEVIRRRAELGASSAGIGASSTNSLSPSNPIANEMGQEGLTNPPKMSGGASGGPADQAMAANKQQKGESQKLTEALVWRMKKLTERGE